MLRNPVVIQFEFPGLAGLVILDGYRAALGCRCIAPRRRTLRHTTALALPFTLPRFPLTFALLALAFAGVTRGPSAYWTSFFPGIALFGVGMGLVVAPLTSTVMGAHPPRFSGAASGVNNAVARGAGALAIAILGSLALFGFSSSLAASTAGLDLDKGARASLQQASSDLGATLPPAGLDAGTVTQVKAAIASSFAAAFRLVLVCCALLALASAVSAALFIKNPQKGEDRGRQA